MTGDPAAAPLLEMRGICKRYGAVHANRNVDLAVRHGCILGLLGENGSGKSTLMKVLFGLVRPDAGTITFRGKRLEGHDPQAALAAGIGMIHQHFTLVEGMSVVENVMLGWVSAGRWLRRRAVAELLRTEGRRYGLEVEPEATVADLPFGRRQRVEILKAVLRGAHLLVLDEPTSNLSPPEVSGLLGALRRLRDEGRAVVFISHKLREVLDVCDEVVVLRAGNVVGQSPVGGLSETALTHLMVGHEPPPLPVGRAPTTTRDRLQVRNLSLRDAKGVWRLRDVSFDLRSGEILAVAGVDGNGQGELAETVAGIRRATDGEVRLDGRDLRRCDARARVAAGVAYVPVDRATTSLVPGMTVAENLALRDFSRSPWRNGLFLDAGAFRRTAQAAVARFDVRCADVDAPAGSLSGGNAQKLVLAREFGRQPAVLLALQPTWGLDPAAARFVVAQILALRHAGGAILYLSAELDEVFAVGDRIAVMYGGRLSPPQLRSAADRKGVGQLMAGLNHHPQSADSAVAP